MDYKTLTILGEPQGKGRPRFTKQGRAYTPKKTAEYEKYIADEYIRQCGESFGNKPIGVVIIGRCKVPKNAPKSVKEKMYAGQIYPTKKPDIDNIGKIILDALNGIAYDDDKQIVNYQSLKRYITHPTENPHVFVCIREVG